MGILGSMIQLRAIGLSQINNPNMPLYQALAGDDGAHFGGCDGQPERRPCGSLRYRPASN